MSDHRAVSHECSEPDSFARPVDLSASPTQVLTGLSTGLPTDHLRCTVCADDVSIGHPVTVYAVELAGRVQWELRRWYCGDCRPRSLEAPTLGATELLVRSRLATMKSKDGDGGRYCLSEVSVVDYSPPREGSDDRRP